MDPDPNGEQEEATDEHRESPKLARAPSFFIGKPLVDFDAGIGRVSWKLQQWKHVAYFFLMKMNIFYWNGCQGITSTAVWNLFYLIFCLLLCWIQRLKLMVKIRATLSEAKSSGVSDDMKTWNM